jgi:IMP cyclohydrolase
VTNYYVYYRVAPARLATLKEEIESLFRSVEAASGVRGRWMRRRDEPSTYMEVYEGVGDEARFEALLEREAARLGLERHVERFVCA